MPIGQTYEKPNIPCPKNRLFDLQVTDRTHNRQALNVTISPSYFVGNPRVIEVIDRGDPDYSLLEVAQFILKCPWADQCKPEEGHCIVIQENRR